MSFLLNTNVVSEFRKRDRMNPGVRAWVEGVQADQMFLSVLVVGEIRQGIERVRRRDVATAQHLDNWMREILTEQGDRILPVTEAVAELWGHLNAPGPLPVIDGLLAATALAHGLTLVTRNVDDVRRTGVPLVDPFS